MKGHLLLDADRVTAAAVFLEGAGVGVVIQRLQAAFQGIVSLLDLNVRMAKVDALENDKSRLDALDVAAKDVASLSPYDSNAPRA